MKLSIVIVNYNVKHFIEQCLISVFNATKNINAEVFVVDNNSVDGSCSMIREKFPQVQLIENTKNYGFSYANNQALKIATGEYQLLLNPDTVVEEDCFEKCIEFMNSHKEAGALSVRMIDGKGTFLPESKRALPTPLVSFYKIFGFSRLFPKSKRFARYHLGHLPENKINEIEILPGAFMFMRKEALKKSGLLDEDYFMYGEDIDLSYRILKAGYKNFYFPETTIIHYKGESTKKGSLNYVFIFYNAMIIFAKKHFSNKNAKIYSLVINLAIYFRAFMAMFNRTIKSFALPIFDIAGIFASYYFIKPIWENFKLGESATYPSQFLDFIVPAYILIWVLSLWFNNGYSKNIKFINLIKGIFFGTIVILAMYALLPLHLRFSRALILIGSASALLISLFNRFLFSLISYFPHQFNKKKISKLVIVGLQNEINRIKEIINKINITTNIIGYVSPHKSSAENYHLGSLDQLQDIVQVNKVDEVIYCAKDIPSNQIIQNMMVLNNYNINFKIAQPDTLTIIGSNSIDNPGEFYSIEINSITSEENIRYKRVFDILISLIVLLLSPILLALRNNTLNLFKNIFNVLSGKKTWVGYYAKSKNILKLPKIKPGILNPLDIKKASDYSEKYIDNLNFLYAKDYKIWNDFLILFKSLRKISRL